MVFSVAQIITYMSARSAIEGVGRLEFDVTQTLDTRLQA
jgi:hypothetical protein